MTLKLVCDCITERRVANFFDRPCQSMLLHVGFVSKQLLVDRQKRKLLSKGDLKKKVVCLPVKDGFVLFPLWHEQET